MDELIIRVLQGIASSAEQEQLRNWRDSSPLNERQYQEIAAIWQATAVHSELCEPARPSANQILWAADTGPCHQKRRTVVRVRHVASVAAALLAGLLIGEFRPGTTPDPRTLEADEFVTGPSELATARLSDGTVVRLAPSTRLRVSSSQSRREVWLDGKAFFAVASNSEVPFIVRTRAGDALVIGTRFQVDVTTEDLEVLVVEGNVEVGGGQHRIQVEAGNVSRMVRGLRPEVSPVAQVGSHLDWMGSFLAFENTPLRQVAIEIENRYSMRVAIADSALARRTVTAWFGDEDPEAVLKVICRIADAHCSIRDGVASIEP